MPEKAIDYSLYLVTSRELLPSGKAFFDWLEEVLRSQQVTVIQIREKDADTGLFLDIARQTRLLCDLFQVPLIVNDRVDIALAIGAAGVHLGQTDMSVSVARKLLPPGSIIGVSCHNQQEALKAVHDGADYIGIGAVWGTQTKSDATFVGVRSVGEILRALDGTSIKAVAIGGIKSVNVLRTMHGCVSSTGHALDGVAVVSEIAASPNPARAAYELRRAVDAFKATGLHTFSLGAEGATGYTAQYVKEAAAQLLDTVRSLRPLVHQITNNVVMTQSANATIALGASPIMATAPQEMEDLAKAPGGLLINFGTIADKAGMLAAGRFANTNGKPVVFDPVGVGATQFRRTTANELLDAWQATVIKGNAAELGALADSAEVTAQGVDSSGSFTDPASVIRQIALKERCIVVLTGVVDWVTDGHTVIRLSNGHNLLGNITGSGCMTGTSIATFCGATAMAAKQYATGSDVPGRLADGDMLIAAVAGVLAICVAAEFAAIRSDVHGPGTFLPALIDEMANLMPEQIVSRAHVEVFMEVREVDTQGAAKTWEAFRGTDRAWDVSQGDAAMQSA